MIPDTALELAWPRHGSSKLWVAALRARLKEKQMSVDQFQCAKLSLRTIEGHLQGHKPYREQLRAWLRRTREPQGDPLTPHLWNSAAEVLDWNALLGYTGRETLDLWQNSADGLEDGTPRINELLRLYQWWSDNLLPPSPLADYVPREIEDEIRVALCACSGFRQPAWPVVFLSGSIHAERRAVLNHLARDPLVFEFFRDGIYWIEAGLPPQQVWEELLEQLGSRAGQNLNDPLVRRNPNDPRARWHVFAKDADHSMLVVVEQPDLTVVRDLFYTAGGQVRFLIEMDARVVALAREWVGNDRVRIFDLGGYTTNEVLRLTKARGLKLTPKHKHQLETIRASVRGDPAALRLAINAMAACTSWSLATVVRHLEENKCLAPIPPGLRRSDKFFLRPALLDTLRRAVLAAQVAPVVVYGVSGTEPAALLTALVDEPEIRLRFADGIYCLPSVGAGETPALTRLQIQMLLAARPSDTTSPEEQVVEHFRERAALICLTNWEHPTSVQWLQNLLPPTCVIVVATSSTRVMASFRAQYPQACLAIPPLSWEEAQAYFGFYFGHTLPLDKAVRQNLKRVYDWNGGNLQGLTVIFQLIDRWGWDKILAQLRAESLSSCDDALLPPFQVAYSALTPALQKYIVRCSELPPLASYDETVWLALCDDVPESQAYRALQQIVDDSGLLIIKSTDEPGLRWRIPSGVVKAMQSLFLRLPPAEQRAAQQWRERAVAHPRFQARYAVWKRTALPSRPHASELFAKLAQQSILKVGWLMLFRPDYWPHWETVQKHSVFLDAFEYLCAWQLYKECWRDWSRLRRWAGIVYGLLALSLGWKAAHIWLCPDLIPLVFEVDWSWESLRLLYYLDVPGGIYALASVIVPAGLIMSVVLGLKYTLTNVSLDRAWNYLFEQIWVRRQRPDDTADSPSD